MTTVQTILAGIAFEPGTVGWLGALALPAGLACVMVAYTLGLRWRQYSLRTRATLLGCRLGAAVCLIVALLHPSWSRQTTTQHKPVLAVVLDDSQSMNEPAAGGGNQTRGPTRYAKAIEVLRKQVAPAVKDGLQLHVYDVEGRPVDLTDLPDKPADTRSPLTQTLLKVQQELRAGLLGKWGSLPSHVLARDNSHGSRLGSFHATQQHTPANSTGVAPGTSMALGTSMAPRTSLAPGTAGAAGILLLSDGAEVTDEPADGALDQIRIPVHTIEIAKPETAPVGTPDLAIEAISANRQGRVGNTVQAVVDLVASGQMPAGPVPISLLDGTRLLASRTVEWKAGETARRVDMEFTPRRPSDLTLTVQVPQIADEVNLSNNRQTFPISVRARPLTVLFIDGVLRWEGKFIRQALGDDPDIHVVSSVRTARAGADRGSQGLLLPEQLANVSLVILGDVEATYFSAEEVKALRAWVTDRRGALLVTGGYHSFGVEGFGRSELRDILPVEFSAAANPQIEQPFQLKLTEIGMQSPIFHLTGDRVRDTAFFQALPPLAGCSRIAGIKPAAQVLAVNPAVTAPDGSQGLPIMIVQQVGTGRTMVLAVDTTWRWRTVVGGFTGDTSFYTRFWGQLARWMIGVDTKAPRQLFASTDRKQYKVGQNIEVNITLRDPAKKGSPSRPAGTQAADGAVAAASAPAGWRVTALAEDEKGNRLNVPLVELGGGRYRGTLGAARPGRWDVLVSAEPPSGPGNPSGAASGNTDGSDESRTQSQVVTVQVDRPDREALDPRPNPQWLAEVSQRTGGRAIRPEQVAEWAKSLPREPIEMVSVQSVELWHHPLLATIFLGLLCVEWFLRRRNRLV